MVDTLDSKSSASNSVWVRVPPSAPTGLTTGKSDPLYDPAPKNIKMCDEQVGLYALGLYIYILIG